MGYDLYGTNAKSEKGDYFRNNVWWWRPLAEFVTDRCEVSSPDDWFHNSGHKVTAEEANQISEILNGLLSHGAVATYEKEYTTRLAELPDDVCDICHGVGVRNDEVVRGTCNACLGKGTVRPWATNYPFSEENVREFAEFCEQSGGFEIH